MSVFIVAELSANHGGDLQVAKDTIKAAKECGADAIKLQTYTADCLTIDCKSEVFKITDSPLWSGKYLYDLYKEAAMPCEWNAELFAYARQIEIECFSTPFSRGGVDLLESIGNPIYKIASFEVVDLDLVDYVARQGKPVILSSGIATNDELKTAIELIKSRGVSDITLLKCVSAYPANIADMNLREMRFLGEKFGVKFGLSDHSLGNMAGIIATSLGASMIEKHFILDKSIRSADSAFSLDRAEFAEFVRAIRNAESALNAESTADSANQKQGRTFARSLFVVKDIKKGEILNGENIRAIRPNAGLPPKFLNEILGKKATHNLPFGKPLEWSDFE
ncbi:pseudaminic acid synthase [Helicobacter sp. 23-1044]